ncbi:MAG: class I SAM-dependent RNA methyltransferase [bacterium]
MEVANQEGGVIAPFRGVVERLGWGGVGVARLFDGRIVLLDSQLAIFPGEEVEAEVCMKARHGEGRITRIIRPDPQRIAPKCPVAESCGGCDLWGASRLDASKLKLEMIDDLVRRNLGNWFKFEWHPAPKDALRHRIQLHWDGFRLGFHRRGTNAIVEVDSCPMAAGVLSAAIPALKKALLLHDLPNEPARWELSTGTPAGKVYAVKNGVGEIYEIVDSGWKINSRGRNVHEFPGARMEQNPKSFFQVCPSWAWQAFGRVFSSWDLSGQVLFDLFGGTGFFSKMLAPKFGIIVLVEKWKFSAQDARRNLRGLPAEIVNAPLNQWLKFCKGSPSSTVIVDPPRKGLNEFETKKLGKFKASNLVYVGCDGATFFRDVRELSKKWRLSSLAVIDLFPNTVHAEFVALFNRPQRLGPVKRRELRPLAGPPVPLQE